MRIAPIAMALAGAQTDGGGDVPTLLSLISPRTRQQREEEWSFVV